MTNDKQQMVDNLNENFIDLYDELILPQGTTDNLSYLGGYNKKILHITDSEPSEFLKNEWSFLGKMMMAVSQKIVKVDIPDMAILNMRNHSHLSVEEVIKKMSPSICMIWGVGSLGGLNENKEYEVFDYDESKIVIVGPILSHQDKDSKIKVWEVIKSIFQ